MKGIGGVEMSKKDDSIKVGTLADKADESFISSGIKELDDLIGGGFAVGRITELWGKEGVGKTHLVTQFMANISKDKKILFCDTEFALNKTRVTEMGANPKNIDYFASSHLEEVCKLMTDSVGKYDDLTKVFGEVDDTLKPILLERLAKETKPKEIQKSIRGSLEATKRLQLADPNVDPLDSLKQEARKYKSAEEFVNSQIRRPQATDNVWQDTLPSGTRPKSVDKIVKSGGNPLYHDTTANGVLGILDSGEIKASQAPFSQIAGQGKRVSTTRNFDNYSRYNKSPYRLVIDESKAGQRAIPDNRGEFESIFKKGVPTKAVSSVSVDITNPALLGDIRSGKLAEVIKEAKEKGIAVEPFEGKVLPNEGANAEVQIMTSKAFSDAFPEYNTKLKQLTDLYKQATAPQVGKTDPISAINQKKFSYTQAQLDKH